MPPTGPTVAPPVASPDLAACRPSTTLVAATGGVAYEVVSVAGADALARRLVALGLWPGAHVELLARAPFGDPLLFRVHGYRLALRRAEAERVTVAEVPGARDAT